MTDIDKLAREISVDVCANWDVSPLTQEGAIAQDAARLGILEGMKLQRERDAVACKCKENMA